MNKKELLKNISFAPRLNIEGLKIPQDFFQIYAEKKGGNAVIVDCDHRILAHGRPEALSFQWRTSMGRLMDEKLKNLFELFGLQKNGLLDIYRDVEGELKTLETGSGYKTTVLLDNVVYVEKIIERI